MANKADSGKSKDGKASARNTADKASKSTKMGSDKAQKASKPSKMAVAAAAAPSDVAPEKDARFKHMHHDPRFRRMKKDDQKVKVDERFKGMFNDDRFKLNYTVDKYGRKVSKSTADDMEKFYALDGEDEDEERDSASSDEEDDSEAEYDPMRGIGVADSSEDEEEGAPDLDAADWVDDGAESDSNVSRGEDTRRLAVCNIDWDHIRAVDLLAVLQSFKPATGIVSSVTVYPSEYGLKRMAEEDLHGPRLFDDADKKASEDEESGDSDDEEKGEDGEAAVDQEALRKYQVERMKYFYAVVECDSVATASQIYKECDGEEYMNTGVLMDLRFIPDDMEFDGQPKDSANEIPADYEPRLFIASALQQSAVKLTWDEDEPERMMTLRRKVKNEDIKEMDYAAYIASGSDTESEIDDSDVKEKYSELMKELRHQDASEEPDQEMEISFEPGLEAKARAALKAKTERDRVENLNVWDQYLEKRKQKRKQKKHEKEMVEKGERLVDDDDVDVDLDDPFFRDADFGPEFEKTAPKADSAETSGKKKKKKGKLTKQEEEDEKKQLAELELLLADDADAAMDRRHFNMKEIVKTQAGKDGKKKKKNKKRGDEAEANDQFDMDVKDSRFQALFRDSKYAVDPTDPRYKDTHAMRQLMDERRVRATEREKAAEQASAGKSSGGKPGENKQVKVMVDSIKRKAQATTAAPAFGKRQKTASSK